MPKIQFSDVTPPDRRSIRNIPIPNSGRRKAPIGIRPEKEQSSPQPTERVAVDMVSKELERYSVGSKSKKRNLFFGLAALVVIVVFIVGMMTVFASASINIVPKNQEIPVNMKISGINGQEAGAVSYEIVKISESKSVSVPANGEEAAEIKASGKIVIYNNFSTESQRLITRTRFESPEGLIYRISESVTVPGRTVKNGLETPGSIEVEVFADEAGEKYNIKKTDFTVPGFKNDADRYKNFYARSSTDMVGGFVGKRKTVLPTDRQAALQVIDMETENNLRKSLESKVPEGLVLVPGAIIYESKELPQREESSAVLIGKEITAYAIMLNAQSLSDKIIEEYVAALAEWNNIESEIKDFSSLTIVKKPENLGAASKIDLEISGKVEILARIDTKAINQRLLGASKEEAAELMNEFKGISSVTAIIRPIWKQSFPDDSSKIHVQTVAN